ncbi:MAG: 16S rRNA (adenine(1518)-N(6)/adenine(1519)-N(6))-dimethyltransferase RsmA [Muribaculaceae bacterium]|nr:16S rRNA (adenine(1518)-N(6)/adenine(1519)-N(6))-dimethyltransferase RsmA [Muribaculaceae bacterium]
MTDVRPKKALGQHFLTDLDVAARIAATLDAAPGMPVLEIGPGMGVLTQYILASGRELDVVEIDTESVAWLRSHIPALDGHIIEGDFLRLPLDTLFGGRPFALIGNYPYNISSQIFFHMLEYRDHVPFCSGMLQREVAERIAAAPGSRTRGILSVLLQLWYDVRYLFTVPPGVFNPPPKVHSGVIELKRNSRQDAGCDERLLRTVVKTAFGQRRKTLRNSLRGLLPPGAQLPDSPMMAMRPEQLSVDQFVELTLTVENLRQK